jgi:hypothetical protein
VWDTTNKFKEELSSNGQSVTPALQGLISFGVGFFFFFISLVPEHMQFIVKLLGFQGDRAKATELLASSKVRLQARLNELTDVFCKKKRTVRRRERASKVL